MRDLGPVRQNPHRLHKAELLPPSPQGHSGVFLEDSLQGSFAGTDCSTNLPEWPAVALDPLPLKGFDSPVTAYDLS